MPKKNTRVPVKTVADLTRSGSTKDDVYEAARALVRSGLSVIPIQSDGSKRPAFELLPRVWSEKEQRHRRPWSDFKTRRPSAAELRAWFRDSPGDVEYGIAVIGGEVSGGVEIIDLDNWDVVGPWSATVEERAPALLDSLVRVKSPRPGLHVYYRCPVFGGNQKLAMVPDPAAGNRKPKTVIELKASAGYCLAPPSPAACHKTNRPYVYEGDLDLTQIPVITPGEREVLLSCARGLNAWERTPRPERAPQVRRAATGAHVRPGDAFNAEADWGEILTPHGWTWVRETEVGSHEWCRPGKSEGVSATSGFAGSELLYVFTSNADPFEPAAWYTKFHAHTLLNHQGDFAASARELRHRGYGTGRRTGPAADPLDRYAAFVPRSFRRDA